MKTLLPSLLLALAWVRAHPVRAVAIVLAVLAGIALHNHALALPFVMAGAYAELGDEEMLGLPRQGDFDQGVGTSTSQLMNPNVSLASTRAIASGPPWQQSLLTFGIILLVLAVIKVVTERGGEKSEFATSRIGIENWLVNGLMVALFFYATKTTLGPQGVIAATPGAVKQFFGAI